MSKIYFTTIQKCRGSEWDIKQNFPELRLIEAGGYTEVIILSSLLLHVFKIFENKIISKEGNREYSIALC